MLNSILAVVNPWTIIGSRLCRKAVITCHSRADAGRAGVRRWEQGGQDSGGNDNEELPPAARRALHELADHNTPVHDDDEVWIGRTRARTRAANQQSASILLATLGRFAATEVVEALIAEQKASENEELPKELIQDVEPCLLYTSPSPRD